MPLRRSSPVIPAQAGMTGEGVTMGEWIPFLAG